MAFDGMAYYRGKWKLIELASGQRELYDIELDPFESTDRAAIQQAVVTDLSARLQAFPRGANIALPLWRIAWDPDEFGGTERAPPFAERVLP